MRDSTHQVPRQVAAAVSILAVNVLLSNSLRTLSVVTGTLSGRIAGEDVFYKSLDEVIVWSLSVSLLYLLWRGHNWARWLNGILAISNIGFWLFRIAKATPDGMWPGVALLCVNIAIEAMALYLLFLSPGKRWYEPRSGNAAV